MPIGNPQFLGAMYVSCQFLGSVSVYLVIVSFQTGPRWWFQIFFIFTPNIGEDEPILTIIFFKGVGSTTNQGPFFSESPVAWVFFKAQAILAGAVSDWNKENPTKAVQPGDRVHGDPGMKMDSKREIWATKKKGAPGCLG